jgi:hypothetical protein
MPYPYQRCDTIKRGKQGSAYWLFAGSVSHFSYSHCRSLVVAMVRHTCRKLYFWSFHYSSSHDIAMQSIRLFDIGDYGDDDTWVGLTCICEKFRFHRRYDDVAGSSSNPVTDPIITIVDPYGRNNTFQNITRKFPKGGNSGATSNFSFVAVGGGVASNNSSGTTPANFLLFNADIAQDFSNLYPIKDVVIPRPPPPPPPPPPTSQPSRKPSSKPSRLPSRLPSQKPS